MGDSRPNATYSALLRLPPFVRQMALRLGRAGLIKREPRLAHSIRLFISPESCQSYAHPTAKPSDLLCKSTS